MQRALNRGLWWTALVVVGAVLVASSACTGLKTSQGATVALDADVDDGLGGTGIESGDVRACADDIARALAYDLRASGQTGQTGQASQRARVAVLPVVNRTRFRIDPALVQNELIHDLSTQSKKRFALVAVRSATQPHATANAVLKTELRSLTKDNGAVTSDFVQYAFTLETHDGEVLWSGMYETKRASSVDVIYQ